MINIPVDGYDINEYPKGKGIKCPNELTIAIVVCGNICGNVEFIVEGQNQVCEYCLRNMKQLASCHYVVAKGRKRTKDKKLGPTNSCQTIYLHRGAREKKIFKDYQPDEYIKIPKLKFPVKIYIALAVCGKQCGNKAFIVDGQSQVCEYCSKNMFRTKIVKYKMKENGARIAVK